MFSGKFPRRVMKGGNEGGRIERGVGRLKTAHAVGVLGTCFFLKLLQLLTLRCVTVKATILCNHFRCTIIFNHLASHKAFRHVTTARDIRSPAYEVLSSFDALHPPSSVPEECHSRSTNRTVHISLKVPNSKHYSIATDISVLQQYAYPQTNFLYGLCLLQYSCYSEPTSR
jgi:hypothetical protein